MTRRRLGFITLCLLVLLGSGGTAALWSLSRVPDFYEEALTAEPDPVVRKQAAKQLVQRTLHLVDDIQHADTWSQEFPEQHVNSWLAEELPVKFARVVPKGVHDPRVRFVPGAMLVGFRLEQPNWRGVISLRLRPFVPEDNKLAVEIVSVRAGLVRIPIDNVLVHVCRQFEREGWQVEWTQANGNDVLVLNLDRGIPNQPVLESLEVVEGKIHVSGTRRPPTGLSPEDTSEPPLFEYPRIAEQGGARY